MIEWLTSTLRFDRAGTTSEVVVETMPPRERDGWRRSTRPFAEARDIDHLYAAARAAGEVSALDHREADPVVVARRPAAGFDA